MNQVVLRENDMLLQRIAAYASTPSPSAVRSTRPRIGIPTSQHISSGKWPLRGVDERIIQCVLDAGGTPELLCLRPLASDEDGFRVVWDSLSHYDGLLLPGGDHDVDPEWYGVTECLPTTNLQPSPWNDWWLISLARLATLLAMPLLGICQGLQYWNVALGGTLYQNLATEFESTLSHRRPEVDGTLPSFLPNTIYVTEPASLFACCMQTGTISIEGACMHRQAVRDPSPQLVVTGRTSDGLVEVLERPDGIFGIATQFHPEVAPERYWHLFDWHVQAAATYAKSQRAQHERLYDAIRAYYTFGAPPFPRVVLPCRTASTAVTA